MTYITRKSMTYVALTYLVTAGVPALAVDALVTSTTPITRTEYVTSGTVYEQRQVCSSSVQPQGRAQSLSDLPNRVLGSPEGMIGTVVGIAIGNNVASGGAYEKAVGALLGNQLGNAMASNRRQVQSSQTCYTEQVPVTQTQQVQRVIGHRVQVELNGNRYTVQREFQPRVGDYIDVQVVNVR